MRSPHPRLKSSLESSKETQGVAMDSSKRPLKLSTLVKSRGVVSERALIDMVAGAPVVGSWWGHPSGQAIFRALEVLREEKDVFLCKLLDGKQTYVHRRLWPALLRLQAEAALWPPLSVAARALLQRVERKGAVQATGKLRLELEAALRVVARSEHTESGAHAVVLSPFLRHFSQEDREAAQGLSLEAAQAALSFSTLSPAKARRVRTSRRRARGKARPGGGRGGRG
jgi:hypothetical protein